MCVCVCVCVCAHFLKFNGIIYCCAVSVMHASTPLLPHIQQELVTSGIIPQFAEEIVEVAEGGEMVRKEGKVGGGKDVL